MLDHNASVCTPVPASGLFSASFTGQLACAADPARYSTRRPKPLASDSRRPPPLPVGEVSGLTDGAYATELLKRQQNPDEPSAYFIKYSRFQRSQTLTSDFGSLGYVEMTFLQPGACLVSASVTFSLGRFGVRGGRAIRRLIRTPLASCRFWLA